MAPSGDPLAFNALSACGVGTRDDLHCWGLLDPPDNDLPAARWQLTPERLTTAPPLRVVSAGAGPFFGCGLSPAGAAYCWGTNSRGQVGDATRAFRRTPTAVAGQLTFRQIAVGVSHACALTPDGAAYCWGSNGYGELGNPSVIGDSPVPVTAAAGARFLDISAGRYFSCGLTVDERISCWGDDTYQALGNGDAPGGPVALPVASTARFRQVSAGSFHTCALDTGGRAYCWGRDEFGVAGVGAPGRLADTPHPVADELTFTRISSGSDFACAISPTGQAYCWGAGGVGQLGDGRSESTPKASAVAGALRFRRVVAGASIAVGIAADGVAYGWGDNSAGRLGDGTRVSRPSPTRVAAPLAFR